uniref:p53 DNA-binding domain-containing protein n=1 Tax=Anopheles epiroticus TaxID=199890 RepID=A0A182PAK0_9DIPT
MSDVLNVEDGAMIEEDEVDMFQTGDGCSQISFLNSQVLQEHIAQFDKTWIEGDGIIPLSQPDSDCALPSPLLDDLKPTPPSAINPYGKYPSVEELCPTAMSFTVTPSSTQGAGFLYSDQLQKLFLKINGICSFDVVRTISNLLPPQTRWYVRAMLVSLAPESLHEPIARCHNHIAGDKEPEEIRSHVIRCKNEQHVYVGVDNGPFFDDRYAVRVPFDEDALSVKLMLQFVCQNTCFNLNVRRTGLVFTLENEQGHIWARRVVKIKICTNYRRDLQNEEIAGKTYTPTSLCLPASSGGGSARRSKPVRSGKRLRRGAKVGRGGPVRLAELADSIEAPRNIEPCAVNITMPSLRMAKRVMDNAIGIISAQILRETDSDMKNQLTTYLDSIRRQRERLTMSNSQCSVDSDLL